MNINAEHSIWEPKIREKLDDLMVVYNRHAKRVLTFQDKYLIRPSKNSILEEFYYGFQSVDNKNIKFKFCSLMFCEKLGTFFGDFPFDKTFHPIENDNDILDLWNVIKFRKEIKNMIKNLNGEI